MQPRSSKKKSSWGGLIFLSLTNHDWVTATVAMISFPLQAKKKEKKHTLRNTQARQEWEKWFLCRVEGSFCTPGLNSPSGETRSVSRCCCSARQAPFPPGSPSNGGIAAVAVLNLLDCTSSTGPSQKGERNQLKIWSFFTDSRRTGRFEDSPRESRWPGIICRSLGRWGGSQLNHLLHIPHVWKLTGLTLRCIIYRRWYVFFFSPSPSIWSRFYQKISSVAEYFYRITYLLLQFFSELL